MSANTVTPSKKNQDNAQTGAKRKYTPLRKEQCAILEQCAVMGLTITEMCAIAEISRRNFYHYCSKNPDFLTKINTLQKKLIAHAKKNIAMAILNEQDQKGGIPLNSWKFLDHKMQLAKLQLERHDVDPEEEADDNPQFIPKVATYQESIGHIQKLLGVGNPGQAKK